MACIVTENIDTPITDEKKYRFLRLKNGMAVLLVSDVGADLAAAALDVNVGSFFDPPNVEGLAHLCEHMLFLGTEQFPDETEYANFIKQHGGSNNAYTEHTHTNYHFSVAPEHLAGALERFAAFFHSPLFTESATDRELNAVDSEFCMRIVNDFIRRWHLLHKLANPKHPFNRFSCGNIQSLRVIPNSAGVDVRKELLAFHERWYSANIMTLVVLGRENLDELQQLVEKYFATVRNTEVPLRPSLTVTPAGEPVFRAEDLGKIVYIVPVKDCREIHFQFVLPTQIDRWRDKPTRYVAHLVGHEGKGSLLSALKNAGLAIGLNSWSLDEEAVSLFHVSVELTEEGATDAGLERVVELVFTYLQLLRTTPPQEWVFREKQALAELAFRYSDKEEPCSFCTMHAKALHLFPSERVLSGAHLLFEYDPDGIREVLQLLSLDNLRLELVGKRYENFCTQKEEIYGIAYDISEISAHQRERWARILHSSPEEARRAAETNDLHFPAPNAFIPEDLSLRKVRQSPASSSTQDSSNTESKGESTENCHESTESSRQPALPHELCLEKIPALRGKVRFFFKQDDTFFLPKLSVRFWVSSAYSAKGVREYMLSWLYVGTVTEMLNELLYDAEIAGLYYSMSGGDWPGEVSFALHGFSDKLPLMLDHLTYAVAHSGKTKALQPAAKAVNGSSSQPALELRSAANASKFAVDSDVAAQAQKHWQQQQQQHSRSDCVLQNDLKTKMERSAVIDKDRKGGLDKKLYDVVWESLMRRLKNRITYRTVYQQAMTVCGEALEEPYFSYEEQVAALEAISFEEVKEVERELFQRARVDGLAVGNMTEEECLIMLETAVGNLNIKESGECLCPKAVVDLSSLDILKLDHLSNAVLPVAPVSLSLRKNSSSDIVGLTAPQTEDVARETAATTNAQVKKLADTAAGASVITTADGRGWAADDGRRVCVRVTQENVNPKDPNNGAFLRIQMGELELRSRAMLALLSHWLQQPFFDEMRTRQQLGYVAQANKNVQLRSHTMDFFIASPHSPELLADRIEAFLVQFLTSHVALENTLPEELFQLHRRALISQLSVKPQSIYEETQRYVVEVYFKSFLFDRYPQTISQLETLTRQEFLDFIFNQVCAKPALLIRIHKQVKATPIAAAFAAVDGAAQATAAVATDESLSAEETPEASGARAAANEAAADEIAPSNGANVLDGEATSGTDAADASIVVGEKTAATRRCRSSGRGEQANGEVIGTVFFGRPCLDVANPRVLRSVARQTFVMPL